MNSLFNAAAYNEIVERLNNLTPETPAQWGKMNVAQMMAHCSQAIKVPLSEKKMPRIFMGRLFGWLIKSKLYNETLYRQGLPTSPDFVIKEDKDFDLEKHKLLELIKRFYGLGPMGINKYPHPFFGKFTPDQWGKSIYKHLDHHLRQFGV